MKKHNKKYNKIMLKSFIFRGIISFLFVASALTLMLVFVGIVEAWAITNLHLTMLIISILGLLPYIILESITK